MATFSDLPNELITDIWVHVIEPEDVESFALVSKNVHALSTRFVKEHCDLKKQYSKISVSRRLGSRGAADLLKEILLNPRIALYINELRILDCIDRWGKQNPPFTVNTMDLFKNAIRHSTIIAPTEMGDWIADLELGNEDPIVALIVMQRHLTKLEKFEIDYLDTIADQYMIETLGRITLSSEAIILPGSSAPESKIDSKKEIGLPRPAVFSNLSALTIRWFDIPLDIISRLLRSASELKSLSYNGSAEPFQICNMLLECHQHSLQELYFNTYNPRERRLCDLCDFTRFEVLTDLKIRFCLLLGSDEKAYKALADVLPMSIERLTLYYAENTRKVVSEMVKSKIKRMPNLKALILNLDTDGSRHTNLFTELQAKSAEVGVLLSKRPFSTY
ncbi:hypothetical protein IMSHALPRED_001029 [Imshaugia aleurites]|uniref:F-box domain-containing protein n=1 Tax=Imshaugia aleurites TaxID=172621 RepID=A0A8H3PE31_9LECA|nr:hypothetical protein IMSHALPRED_001029 [Imshaugia aleurites]